MTIFGLLRTGAWTPALGGGVVSGAIVGIFMGRYATMHSPVLLSRPAARRRERGLDDLGDQAEAAIFAYRNGLVS